ncbi:MAG: extracellular solute-binding protein [Planctomycetes bacterium]|nr:extracellular solute-binding protein [Planctomycetota bacterium]
MIHRHTGATIAAAIAAALACGCGGEADREDLVAYVAHDLILSGPVLREFERRSGLRIRIVGDTEATKTTGLANRLLQSKDRPEADVFWNNEAMQTARLAEAGLFEAFVPPTAVGIPPEHCDPGGRWVGFAARARVIVHNTRLLASEDAPRSIFDLAAPRFRGEVVIANPLFGTTATHAAALFAHLGAEKAKAFLRALKENGVQVAAGNAMACRLVAEGHHPVCLTDTDDANAALLKGMPISVIYPDQDRRAGEDAIGTLIIPNTVALVRRAPHPEGARRLMEYLASAEVEQALARARGAQMPLRPGLAPYDERFDLSRIKAMDVDWSRAAAAAGESMDFVREVFLR